MCADFLSVENNIVINILVLKNGAGMSSYLHLSTNSEGRGAEVDDEIE